ncbi:MAG: hypothetical protein ACTHW2_08070 [Tissierella sp.]|uniref:hypothetical protein n=1 Tax=Tissierella sp. TaxID=41274 RepID=UPI003F976CB3
MSKFNYFKVNKDMLDIELKKSELWVYLTHCRTSNIKKSIQTEKLIRYSLSGITKVKELFGEKASKKMYDKAIESLIKKGLLKEIDIKAHGINKKFYKTDTAIQIIESDLSIQIPIILLDKKLITRMNTDEILTIIKLYNHYEPSQLNSIDKDYIRAYSDYNKKGYRKTKNLFGEGFNRSIYIKKAYEVVDFDTCKVENNEIDINIIDELIKKGLFRFKPVIMEVDEEDEDIEELKYELFKGLVSFKDCSNSQYTFTGIKDNQVVIWVLEPLHCPYIKPYIAYSEQREKAFIRAKFIYSLSDDLTKKKHRRYALYHESTYEYINDLNDKGDISEDDFYQILYLKDELLQYTYENGVLEIYFYGEKLKSLQEQRQIEIENIRLENLRVEELTGKRSRITTNNNLKVISKRIDEINHNIAYIQKLEDDLLELIPIEATEQFFYDSDYEVENVGKATRVIQ